MRVGLVGCGVIGSRRAETLKRCGDELVMAADVIIERARKVECAATSNWREVVERDDLDAVIVSTTNNWLAPVTIAALENGKHVLCEKPLGRNVEEARAMVAAALASGRRLKTGFNHRHHAGIWQAHQMFRSGAAGEPMFMRCRYGHGGRPGYGEEWRANSEIAGGGELLDQGVHAMDLFRWFLGDFAEAFGYTGAYVWTRGAVEDNAFALFRTAHGQIASLHASWTQWKNIFALEIFGDRGYLVVEGLGGSYGLERLIWGKRRPDWGPPEEQLYEFPGADSSWEAEWREFTHAIGEQREPLASGCDGLAVMRMVAAIYESARTGRTVKLDNA